MEEGKALAYTYRLLAARSYFTKDIREKLLKKGVAMEVIEKVVATCTEQGYLDDDRESRLYIQGQMRKGKGPILIKQKVALADLVDELYTREVEIDVIRKVLEKRGDKKNEYTFLLRRGFRPDSIMEVI